MALAGNLARSQQPPRQSPKPNKEQTKPDDRGTEQSPFVIKILPAPDADETKKPQQQGNGWLSGWSLSDKIAAFVVFVGFLQFVALIATWLAMRDTARRQLRAYVFVSRANISNATEGNGPVQSRVVIKNFGQTPAYKVVNINGFAFDQYPPPPTLNLTIADHEFGTAGRSRSDLGPTQSEGMTETLRRPPLNAAERAALMNGGLVMYVYGEIRYLDAFGRKQRTRYRFMMGGPVGTQPGGALVACEDGNEAT
jgi:hypothetical protein